MSLEDIYLITLSGPADFQIKVIGQEKYDWIFTGQPLNAEIPDPSHYIDTTCPEWIRQEIWKDSGTGSLDKYQVRIRQDNPSNDKARLVVDDYGTFFDLNDYTEFIITSANKYNLIDTYVGYDY